MDNLKLAENIIEALGGKSNVKIITNCMTRMRVTVKERTLVDNEKIKNFEGVLGLVADDDYFQVILGPGKAAKVTDAAVEHFGLTRDEQIIGNWEENKENIKSMQKSSSLKKGVRVIANIFIPLIPAIIAAGLFSGFASLISSLNTGGNEFVTGITTFFTLIGRAFLGYFVIFTGINAAKQFGATEALGGIIGAISIGPQIVSLSKMMGLFNDKIPLESILTTGKGGIIGVIIGVYILSKVEKALRKKIPDVLDLIVTPFLSLLITGLIFVFVIMPFAGFASDILVAGLSVIINSSNPVVSVISGYVLSALFLPMVLLGLHHGLIPIYAIQLESMGGVSLFPVLAMAGAGQVGAAIAIYMKARKLGNNKLKKIIAGALPAGVLGVGEPLIYGVTLPMFKPFITAGLGAGFGGAFIMFNHVMATAWGPSGIVATPLMVSGKILPYIMGLLISYIGGFIITTLFINDDDVNSI
ncbi:PTS transporter subunit EIIC [Pasteurella skyensis]|uniref:PTS system N-acetylmuramic acid-specific EIIBC component n=1 Tax=Phocoenobacter skyensis TaxID=97481 RepID=A0AAJ6P1B5_9PAST|nr:PTS transporter subunit EIIC [Pasteurella skyensis]MDP8162692.1 PTS transporter subunit EIIC [Pasteurella skyensis]MDP8173460.1 PTS transporter subunit EIIC [Pasteurella skyensis]MDP8177621.1 PTS transporter subunit EIIC [Pasteurella skyensis]MDP8178794.1 PTS transporter subunit EIIC [Pasteurella skyensis]MDP8183094.1 PTS transporter subunit EIIC [Pasteurella skyensis]